MSDHSEKLWVSEPSCLLRRFSIYPSSDMSTCEKFNSVMRFIIVVTIILILIDFKDWFIFLVVAGVILAILSLSYTSCSDDKQEEFSLNPTYACGAQPFTTVPPVLGEEWISPSPVYNEYTNLAVETPFAAPGYPTGSCPEDENFPVWTEYVTSTNLRPFSFEQIQNTSLADSTLYMNDVFTSSQLEYRNNMSRNAIDKINRNFSNGFQCVDQLSPTF